MTTRTKNMKILMSGDTTPYQKSIVQASNKTKTFKKDASSALGDISSAFGVNMGPVTTFTSKYVGSLKGVYTGLVSAKKGANIYSSAMKIVKMATMATGVGALLIAFVSLIAMFKSSEEGAYRLKKMMEPLKVAFDNIIDIFADFGDVIYKAFQNPKESITKLWEHLKTNLLNRVQAFPALFAAIGKSIGAAFKMDWDGVKAGAADAKAAYAQILTGLDTEQQQNALNAIKTRWQENAAEMKKASALQDKIYATDLKERAHLVERKKMEAEVARLRLKARQDQLTDVDSSIAALNKANELQDKLLKTDGEIAKSRLEIQQEQNSYARSSAENLNAEAELEASLFAIQAARQNSARQIQRELNTLTKQSNAEKTKALKLEQELNTSMGLNTDGIMRRVDEKAGGIVDPATSQQIGLRLDNTQLAADTAEAKQIWDNHTAYLAATTLDLSATINSAISNAAVGIGEMLGSLTDTSGGFQSFGSIVGEALASMAINVGKMSIGIGMAVLGIKEALMSLNPYVAIAAGIALVALGTAARNQMSNMASGGSTGSISTSSSSSYDATGSGWTSSNIGDSETKEINVVLSGELTASGSSLKTVLNKEEQRVHVAT